MASIQKYQTKQGILWLYKIYTSINPETGKRSRITKRGFKTMKEAKSEAIREEQKFLDGLFQESSDMTFYDVYTLWIEQQKNITKKSTQYFVQCKFKKQILPFFRNIKIQKITRKMCQDFVNQIEIKSKNEIKMYVNQVFKFALKQDILKKNPMEFVIVPKLESEFIHQVTEEQKNFMDKNQVTEFLSILRDNCMQKECTLFHLLLYTGARKGEVLALQWKDIDFTAKTIKFEKTLYFENKQHILQTTKTTGSNRIINIDDGTVELLIEWKEQSLDVLNEESFVFKKNDGTPLRLAYPNEVLNGIIKKFSLEKITVHGLRHTHASLLFEAGASIKEVQARLGHSDVNITLNIYTHVTKSAKMKTAEKFSNYLNNI